VKPGQWRSGSAFASHARELARGQEFEPSLVQELLLWVSGRVSHFCFVLAPCSGALLAGCCWTFLPLFFHRGNQFLCSVHRRALGAQATAGRSMSVIPRCSTSTVKLKFRGSSSRCVFLLGPSWDVAIEQKSDLKLVYMLFRPC
jgi:hypothetical protein